MMMVEANRAVWIMTDRIDSSLVASKWCIHNYFLLIPQYLSSPPFSIRMHVAKYSCYLFARLARQVQACFVCVCVLLSSVEAQHRQTFSLCHLMSHTHTHTHNCSIVMTTGIVLSSSFHIRSYLMQPSCSSFFSLYLFHRAL